MEVDVLDKVTRRILKTIESKCESDNYNVLEKNEIIADLPKNTAPEVLDKYIDYLSSHKYIDIKYNDDNEICLLLLPKTRLEDEEIALKKNNNKKVLRLAFLISMVAAISGFFGAFLGSYIYQMLG